MTYTIAICDDNPIDTHYLSTLVSKWAKLHTYSCKIDTFPSAESFLFQYETNKNYQILLLDIEMGAMNGVTMAKKIRQDNESVQNIFITGYSDYIAEGYEVSALHYLMKPVKEEKLYSVLDRATHKLKDNDKILYLELSDSMVQIPFYEIRWLEVQQNYVTVHCKQDYTVKKTMREFEALLDQRFFRTSRSYLVNLKYIQKVTKYTVYLSDGSIIPLSRSLYDSLNRAIIKNEY